MLQPIQLEDMPSEPIPVQGKTAAGVSALPQNGQPNQHDNVPMGDALLNPDRKQWQSLNELDDDTEFDTFLERNPRHAAGFQQSGLNRRSFLKLMGATLAMTGVTACNTNNRPTSEPIIPYVKMPEELVAGKPLFFASSMIMGGFATGVLIETHEGRPTRIEGNPNHPASLGSAGAFQSASILDLYNPDRSTTALNNGSAVSIDDFATAASALASGNDLAILTETVTSPTLTKQIEALGARWVQYEPLSQDNAIAGAQIAFGQAINTVYHFDQADVVLSLDADFLASGPSSLRYARDFMERRKVRDGITDINRLYTVESVPGNTGATADHRLPLKVSAIDAFARSLASALGISTAAGAESWDVAWFSAVVEDLQNAAGASIVIAGAHMPPAVHVLAHAINNVLGNVGKTVTYIESPIANPSVQVEGLAELVADMNSGSIKTLLIIGGNPLYTAPADLGLADAVANVETVVHLSQEVNETSKAAAWHIPQTHYIEEWSDAAAFDGTYSIVQPPIGPLFKNVRSAHELVAIMAGDERSGYEIVRATWEESYAGDDFDAFWRQSIHDGVVPDSAAAAITPNMVGNVGNMLPDPTPSSGTELYLRADPTIWDGRFAGNAWLQEAPKPITKLTWDNAALMSPATADELGLESGNLIDLNYGGETLSAAVWVTPGHAPDAVSLSLGYGRSVGSEIGLGSGFNGYLLRTSDSPYGGDGLSVVKTGGNYALASTQRLDTMEESDPVHVMTMDKFLGKGSDDYGKGYDEQISLYDEWNYEDGNAWGMSIDLSTCIGCNDCTIACQSENNVPTVGKEQVLNSRQMHWIRVDRYFEGDMENPDTHFQPVACVHCEKAPCEIVCPVQATVHSDEGLNQMVYNRCIGTRYCSANCPYGARRFNFLDYREEQPNIIKEMMNPDVTVRARGVMEKCTYCVQRISRARIDAKIDNRPIADGEVMPACASACPTQAITFGNINDPQSKVVAAKAQSHNYSLLDELGTDARTTYLARVKNPHASLAHDGEDSH